MARKWPSWDLNWSGGLVPESLFSASLLTSSNWQLENPKEAFMKVKIFIQILEEGGRLWAMQTWKEACAGQSKQCWGGREAGTPGTIVS